LQTLRAEDDLINHGFASEGLESIFPILGNIRTGFCAGRGGASSAG
jgi:hypothetical protein